MMNQPLNERLREERKRKGLTQEQLAGLMNVSRQTISHWETGRAAPDYDSLRLLAEALGLSTAQLLGEETTPQETAEPSTPEEALPSQPQKRPLPRIAYRIGAALLALCAAAAVLLLWHPSEPAEDLITPEFFLESSPRVEGMAYIDIVAYQVPIPRSPTKSATIYQWFYPLYLREENGVAFSVELLEEWSFFANGSVSYSQIYGEDIPWVNSTRSTIRAGGSREYSVGDTSGTLILGTGYQITGTDEFGNKLYFRKYFPYCAELEP